jgi:hypothetical protein
MIDEKSLEKKICLTKMKEILNRFIFVKSSDINLVYRNKFEYLCYGSINRVDLFYQ